MKQQAKGDCFKRSFNLFVNGTAYGQSIKTQIGELKLVQGIVYHEETGTHVHGWVEDDVFCYDFINGKLMEIPKDIYYHLGFIKTGNGEIFRYTKEEAIRKALKIGKYYISNLPCKD